MEIDLSKSLEGRLPRDFHRIDSSSYGMVERFMNPPGHGPTAMVTVYATEADAKSGFGHFCRTAYLMDDDYYHNMFGGWSNEYHRGTAVRRGRLLVAVTEDCSSPRSCPDQTLKIIEAVARSLDSRTAKGASPPV